MGGTLSSPGSSTPPQPPAHMADQPVDLEPTGPRQPVEPARPSSQRTFAPRQDADVKVNITAVEDLRRALESTSTDAAPADAPLVLAALRGNIELLQQELESRGSLISQRARYRFRRQRKESREVARGQPSEAEQAPAAEAEVPQPDVWITVLAAAALGGNMACVQAVERLDTVVQALERPDYVQPPADDVMCLDPLVAAAAMGHVGILEHLLNNLAEDEQRLECLMSGSHATRANLIVKLLGEDEDDEDEDEDDEQQDGSLDVDVNNYPLQDIFDNSNHDLMYHACLAPSEAQSKGCLEAILASPRLANVLLSRWSKLKQAGAPKSLTACKRRATEDLDAHAIVWGAVNAAASLEPLFVACAASRPAVVQLLLSCTVATHLDPPARLGYNSASDLVWDWAMAITKDADVMEVLVRKADPPQIFERCSWFGSPRVYLLYYNFSTLLCTTAVCKDIAVVQRLLDLGADLCYPSRSRNTAQCILSMITENVRAPQAQLDDDKSATARHAALVAALWPQLANAAVGSRTANVITVQDVTSAFLQSKAVGDIVKELSKSKTLCKRVVDTLLTSTGNMYKGGNLAFATILAVKAVRSHTLAEACLLRVLDCFASSSASGGAVALYQGKKLIIIPDDSNAESKGCEPLAGELLVTALQVVATHFPLSAATALATTQPCRVHATVEVPTWSKPYSCEVSDLTIDKWPFGNDNNDSRFCVFEDRPSGNMMCWRTSHLLCPLLGLDWPRHEDQKRRCCTYAPDTPFHHADSPAWSAFFAIGAWALQGFQQLTLAAVILAASLLMRMIIVIFSVMSSVMSIVKFMMVMPCAHWKELWRTVWYLQKRFPLLLQMEYTTMPALVSRVPLPGWSSAPSRAVLQPLLEAKVADEAINSVFETHAIRAFVEFRWHYFVQLVMGLMLVEHCMYTAVFILYARSTTQRVAAADAAGDDSECYSRLELGCMIALALMTSSTVLQEARKARCFGVKIWLRHVWTWLALVSFGLIIAILALHWQCTGGWTWNRMWWMRSLSALMVLLLFLRLLYFSLAVDKLGTFMHMVFQVFRDMPRFFLLLAVVFVGFSTSFVILQAAPLESYSSDSPVIAGDDTVGGIFMSLFAVIFGGFDTEYMGQEVGPPAVSILLAVLKALYQVLVAIFLLNILISIIGDSHDRVKDMEATVDIRNKATLIVECEALVPQWLMKFINAKLCRKWLYTVQVQHADLSGLIHRMDAKQVTDVGQLGSLAHASEGGVPPAPPGASAVDYGEDEWHGRTAAIKKCIRREVANLLAQQQWAGLHLGAVMRTEVNKLRQELLDAIRQQPPLAPAGLVSTNNGHNICDGGGGGDGSSGGHSDGGGGGSEGGGSGRGGGGSGGGQGGDNSEVNAAGVTSTSAPSPAAAALENAHNGSDDESIVEIDDGEGGADGGIGNGSDDDRNGSNDGGSGRSAAVRAARTPPQRGAGAADTLAADGTVVGGVGGVALAQQEVGMAGGTGRASRALPRVVV